MAISSLKKKLYSCFTRKVISRICGHACHFVNSATNYSRESSVTTKIEELKLDSLEHGFFINVLSQKNCGPLALSSVVLPLVWGKGQPNVLTVTICFVPIAWNI